jgi:hypothetical protein
MNVYDATTLASSDSVVLLAAEDLPPRRRRVSALSKVGATAVAAVLLLGMVLWRRVADTGSRLRSGKRGDELATIVNLQQDFEQGAAAPPKYGTEWQELIEGTECPETKVVGGATIACEESAGSRHFRFPVGMFDIDRQVTVPAKTIIEGAADPNDPVDKAKKPDPSTQTYFVATHGVTDGKAAYCGTGGNLQPGDAEKLRIGFLLNSYTTVKYINYQGKDTVRPDDNGNLCGGGAFETPGCVSPGFGDGVGYGWEGKRNGCYDHTGQPNNLIFGDGKGVTDVVIDSVRVNDLLKPDDPSQYAGGMASQVAVWVAMTNDGSASSVQVRNLVSMLTRGDGINFHGNVQNSVVEDCHIENTGDDNYALWGAYGANPSGVVFRNNVAVNPGVTRNYGYGVCAAIYGAKDVEITGLKCYDIGTPQYKHQANANGCMVYVHDGWFGAIYPPGNTIKLSNNEWYDMTNTDTKIADGAGGRHRVCNDKWDKNHVV